MDAVESVWEHKRPGFVYGRYGTANHTMLEDLVAALEGAEAAVACASGMGATTALLFGLFGAGDHIVAARDSRVHGRLSATRASGWASRPSSWTPPTRAFLAAPARNTRAVFGGASTCPAVGGRPASRRAGRRGVDDRGCVDGLARRAPTDSAGATVVLHSLTKFISGHGDVTEALSSAARRRWPRPERHDPRRHQPGPLRRVAGGARERGRLSVRLWSASARARSTSPRSSRDTPPWPVSTTRGWPRIGSTSWRGA
jgi:hypothetical protein